MLAVMILLLACIVAGSSAHKSSSGVQLRRINYGYTRIVPRQQIVVNPGNLARGFKVTNPRTHLSYRYRGSNRARRIQRRRGRLHLSPILTHDSDIFEDEDTTGFVPNIVQNFASIQNVPTIAQNQGTTGVLTGIAMNQDAAGIMPNLGQNIGTGAFGTNIAQNYGTRGFLAKLALNQEVSGTMPNIVQNHGLTGFVTKIAQNDDTSGSATNFGQSTGSFDDFATPLNGNSATSYIASNGYSTNAAIANGVAGSGVTYVDNTSPFI